MILTFAYKLIDLYGQISTAIKGEIFICLIFNWQQKYTNCSFNRRFFLILNFQSEIWEIQNLFFDILEQKLCHFQEFFSVDPETELKKQYK